MIYEVYTFIRSVDATHINEKKSQINVSLGK